MTNGWSFTCSDCGYDWFVDGDDLGGGDQLRDALVLSLFTEQTARDDDDLDGSRLRGGYWGNPTMGSRLRLLQHSGAVQATLDRAKDLTEQALAWLISDGVASTVSVNVTHNGAYRLLLSIDITQPDQSVRAFGFSAYADDKKNYTWTWQQ